MGALKDFAGGQNLHFFGILPPYVDKTKHKPGFSELPQPTVGSWVQSALLLRHVWASPNLVWMVIAIAFYVAHPYDLSADSVAAQAPLSLAFFKDRMPWWLVITFAYNGFFFVTLVLLKWSDRPFIPNRIISADKMAHNFFYSLMGIIIWTGFDNVFAFLWATGRLPYLSDKQALAGGVLSWDFLRLVLGMVMIPLWRDAHFYFAHRLLHYKPIFQQVHSLHHRNTDIEPFSGLTMHPVEHLYYYACIFPSVFFFCSPLHFLWNGIHLLLSPGASHSGFEDHFQADNFHYMHHRYFECNYAGFSAGFLDVVFNTFMGKFKEKNEDEEVKQRNDAKSTLRSPPTLEFVTYLSLSILFLAVWAYVALNPSTFSAVLSSTPAVAMALAALAGFGPAVLAFVMSWIGGGKGSSVLEPFQKKGAFENVLHLSLGNLFCAVPVTVACYLCLLQKA